tara:strand:- start:1187 stop:1984 length:798 start_codon:yes stop_codon:yes gene_type:complete
MLNQNLFCNNCGIYGHVFHNCWKPITSYGIVLYKQENGITQYLLIRRKDSLGFVDFIRGKYKVNSKQYIINILEEMTISERNMLNTYCFRDLWETLWGKKSISQYNNEENVSKQKFNQLKKGITVNNTSYNLSELIDQCINKWSEPEWGFPKGRRNYKEKDLKCALREFSEETGYNISDIDIIENLDPIEELFTGSNYKSYKHTYFIAKLKDGIDYIPNYQKSEVSALQWMDFDTAVKKIRPYNVEKIDILKKIDNILKSYNIYL